MFTGKSKIKRTILCLGPPHSGKSVFSYLLFKAFRFLGDDTRIMDGDFYSPTFRRKRIEEYVSEDERDYIITTPNAQKLNSLTEETFGKLAHAIHELIENNGVIVLDGIGLHSDSTESLLKLADNLIILCKQDFNIEENSVICKYIRDDTHLHPFNFYDIYTEKCMKIVTHYKNEKSAYFNENILHGELYDLDRDIINKGDISGIPEETRKTILDIANYILTNWI